MIEDSPTIIELIRQILPDGVELLVARNHEEAAEVTADQHDFAIIDVLLQSNPSDYTHVDRVIAAHPEDCCIFTALLDKELPEWPIPRFWKGRNGKDQLRQWIEERITDG